ncbi:MAG: hypothetical protein WD314_07415 [Trueperaceae bacterium]
MEMTPLTLVVLLAFGLLIAVCLTAWTALSFDRRPRESAADGTASSGRKSARPMSNDEVRGARSRGERPVGRDRDEHSVDRSDTRSRRAGTGPKPASGQTGGSWRSATATPTKVTTSWGTEPVTDDSSNGRKRPSTPANRSGAAPEQELDEDAFERFLRVRPDDIDIR